MLSICFDYRILLAMYHNWRPSASRVLVILPPHPISDGEVRKGRDQKQGEVLVVGVFNHSFQNLSHSQETGIKVGYYPGHVQSWVVMR